MYKQTFRKSQTETFCTGFLKHKNKHGVWESNFSFLSPFPPVFMCNFNWSYWFTWSMDNDVREDRKAVTNLN